MANELFGSAGVGKVDCQGNHPIDVGERLEMPCAGYNLGALRRLLLGDR